MKISAKGRYALLAMITLTQRRDGGSAEPLLSLAKHLDLSKLYLEQVFSLLRRAGLVQSIKGPQGGYRLAKDPREITGWDILSATESALLEQAEARGEGSVPGIERTLRSMLFDPLDKAISASLGSVTLEALAQEANRQDSQEGYIYII